MINSGGRAAGQKGKRWERDLVKRHRQLGMFSQRTPMSGAGSIKNDVISGPVSFEAKNSKNCSPLAWLQKATLGAAGRIPVVAWNPGDSRNAVAIMWLNDLETLLAEVQEGASQHYSADVVSAILGELHEVITRYGGVNGRTTVP